MPANILNDEAAPLQLSVTDQSCRFLLADSSAPTQTELSGSIKDLPTVVSSYSNLWRHRRMDSVLDETIPLRGAQRERQHSV
jgi:hypothetical protein